MINIHEAKFEEVVNSRGERWRSLDLSGEHIGVRIEDLSPGDSSSVHHYHTLEEEHVLALEGTATLILGSQELAIRAGDHVWFAAGDEQAHHIENRSAQNFKFLVFGERRDGDVVFYPERGVMLVKARGNRQFKYEERAKPKKDEA
jgi:uncharacterized cupin superfamily protein